MFRVGRNVHRCRGLFHKNAKCVVNTDKLAGNVCPAFEEAFHSNTHPAVVDVGISCKAYTHDIHGQHRTSDSSFSFHTLVEGGNCLHNAAKYSKHAMITGVGVCQRHAVKNDIRSTCNQNRIRYFHTGSVIHKSFPQRSVSGKERQSMEHNSESQTDGGTSILVEMLAADVEKPPTVELEEQQDFEFSPDLERILEQETLVLNEAAADDQSWDEDETADASDRAENIVADTDGDNTEYEEEDLSLDDDEPKEGDKDPGPDPEEPMSHIPCSGCGALLHCQDPTFPGFIATKYFKGVPKKKLKGKICERCTLMRKHNVALNLSVDPEEYNKIIKSIKQETALVMVVVDVTDMPNSIFRNLASLIGKKRPLYIVGNKVDLLPRDAKGYLDRTQAMLEQMCEQYGLTTSNYVKHTALISAKTGYGVEQLITRLLNDWARKGHVYVVGCTNVGKSTLFNTLLSSDYCKSLARDHIHRATTSVWPGTTLNVLKFPIIDPAPWRLYRRVQRLLRDRPAEVQEDTLKKMRKHPSTKLIGPVGQTFEGAKASTLQERDYGGYTSSTYAYDTRSDGIVKGSARSLQHMRDNFKKEVGKLDEDQYKQSRWCYDTPGVVNPEQVINILTQEELSTILSRRVIMPRTFVLKPRQTIYVSGLSRIDYLEGAVSIYLTVMACRMVKVHVMDTVHADDFYHLNIGSSVLGVPLGDASRLQKVPSLVGKQFSIQGIGWKESMADITLSSLGWVAVTAGMGMPVDLRAYTPGARGLGIRSPSLLPYAVNQRGRRIRGSASYKLHSYRKDGKDEDD